MELKDMQTMAHETAKEKGWWNQRRSPLEIHMLIVSEVAEATEAARVGEDEQEKEELADVVIRILDYFGHKNWDLHESLVAKLATNKSRAFRHGGKLY